MKKISLSFIPYEAPYLFGKIRRGSLIKAVSEDGAFSLGEIAPLPGWSKDSLQEALSSIKKQQAFIESCHWSFDTVFSQLQKLELTPSALFGLETALLGLLDPISYEELEESALFMGSYKEVLLQAEKSACKSAKVKVSTFSPLEIKSLVKELSPRFCLRLDANRAFTKKEAIERFSALEGIDYVEEPLKEPGLSVLPFPIAIDESYPSYISLEELKRLPNLKAIVYKPTILGGITNCKPLLFFAKESGVKIVLSSCFETSIGQKGIKSMAKRLNLSSPLGMGTKDFFPCPFDSK